MLYEDGVNGRPETDLFLARELDEEDMKDGYIDNGRELIGDQGGIPTGYETLDQNYDLNKDGVIDCRDIRVTDKTRELDYLQVWDGVPDNAPAGLIPGKQIIDKESGKMAEEDSPSSAGCSISSSRTLPGNPSRSSSRRTGWRSFWTRSPRYWTNAWQVRPASAISFAS